MIISVDTTKDTPESMRAAAKLILDLAGESSPVPREPVPPLRRFVPDIPETPAPSPIYPLRRVEPEAAPMPVKPIRVFDESPENEGAKELGLEVYEEGQAEPKPVTMARETNAREEKQKAAEKPVPKLPGNIRVY